MLSNSSLQKILPYVIILCVALSIIIRFDLHTPLFNGRLLQESNPQCFTWNPTFTQTSRTSECLSYSKMSSLVWTYEGTGFSKYLQWIVTRKLSNVQVIRLNDNCQITYKRFYSADDADRKAIQVYIMPLSVTLTDQSSCAIKISKMANDNVNRVKQIYFKRKSIQATFFFQQLDSMPIYSNFTSNMHSLQFQKIEKSDYLISDQWTTIYSEDLIKSDLIDCEKQLTNLLGLLRVNISSPKIKSIIEYDSHRFTEDATWWDQSDVAQRLLTNSIPARPSNVSYSNDFYHLHGSQPFIDYLHTTRKCVSAGTFPQLQIDTPSPRPSTDVPERCSRKAFDCAFSDIYSFADREHIYQPMHSEDFFNNNTLKCGFIVPSIFDEVRRRYARNHTCETIVFTLVMNCYDPLPEISENILPSFCFVALVDPKTIEGIKTHYKTKLRIDWDFINLGADGIPFSVPVKSVESMKILGERLFPLAKWIIWLDGKAHIYNIIQIIIEAEAPVLGLAHPDETRTSASEVPLTYVRVTDKEGAPSKRLNDSIEDIRLQEAEYSYEGFYNRSDALGLRLYDIAVFIYRNNHPCIGRYLCAWHNEVNYYSYRGQLSVYYPAVRFNLTNYLYFLAPKFYQTFLHVSIC